MQVKQESHVRLHALRKADDGHIGNRLRSLRSRPIVPLVTQNCCMVARGKIQHVGETNRIPEGRPSTGEGRERAA